MTVFESLANTLATMMVASTQAGTVVQSPLLSCNTEASHDGILDNVY
jgi:hypothetical protein